MKDQVMSQSRIDEEEEEEEEEERTEWELK
jgi:hypothetical protein